MYEITMLLGGIWFQFRQIAPYWASGLIAGSLVSVFLSEKITEKMANIASGKFWLIPLCLASFLGIVSPLCMYGTVPIIAALGKKGVSQHLLATFMVSSILLNPNIIFLSFALGTGLALARLTLSFLSGVLAGVIVYLLYNRNIKVQTLDANQCKEENQCIIENQFKEEKQSKKENYKKSVFSFDRFAQQKEKKKKSFFPDLFKAFRITAPYLLFGLTLTAVFDRYVPPDWISAMFGVRRGLGVLFAATLSIPLYACGGGTIPLINAWLQAGMGAGDAMAFMLAGPALKINNLSAVKMILGTKHFLFYIVYSIAFAVLAGLIINVIVN